MERLERFLALHARSQGGQHLMNKTLVLLCGVLFACQISMRAAEPCDAALGVWSTTDDRSEIRIFKQGDKFFGQIISLKKPNWPANAPQGMGGKPKNDRKNPDPALRSRAVAGIQMMEDFTYSGGTEWGGGRIYDPESGKTYKCKMWLTGTNQLKVHGYVGFSLIGRTVIWTRKSP